MLGRHSASNSVSSGIKGKFRGVLKKLTGGYEDDFEAAEVETVKVTQVEKQEDLEVHTIETKTKESVKIYVTKVPEAAYFESEEYAPTIVSSAEKRARTAAPAAPVKKEKVAVAEPADLFRNAIRRPVRQKFDASTPVFKTKSVAEPMPIMDTDVKVEEVQTVSAEPIVAAPVEDAAVVFAESFVAESVTVETVSAEPVVAAPVEVPVVEAPVEEEAVEEIPAEVVPVIEPVEVVEAPVEDVEPVVIETNEIIESKVECEIAAAVPETPVLALPASKVVPALPQRIEVPELESVAAETEITYNGVLCCEMAQTSAEAIETSNDSAALNRDVARKLPTIISNVDRDILFAFRSELEHDEADFFATTVDDNLAFREDALDEAEFTFKIRVSRPRFTGDLRNMSGMPYIPYF